MPRLIKSNRIHMIFIRFNVDNIDRIDKRIYSQVYKDEENRFYFYISNAIIQMRIA